MVGSRIKSERESSRLFRRQLKRPDVRKCWAGNEALQVVDGRWNADAVECQHWRPGRSSPTGTVVRGRSDNDELSLPARCVWWNPQKARHYVTSRQTSVTVCRWVSVEATQRLSNPTCKWRRRITLAQLKAHPHIARRISTKGPFTHCTTSYDVVRLRAAKVIWICIINMHAPLYRGLYKHCIRISDCHENYWNCCHQMSDFKARMH